MREFKLRASASGKLATTSRSKSEALSQTSKTYLQEWAKQEIYGVRKDISSKYLDKGIAVENDAIDYAAQELGWLFATKNEEYFENEHFCGTPDLVLEDTIIDIKSSWDCFTFPLFEEDIPNKDYYYQLQVYMHLTGKKQAELVYVLMNTPEDLAYSKELHDYSGISAKHRVKVFKIDYDEDAIELLTEKVGEAKEYLNKINK